MLNWIVALALIGAALAAAGSAMGRYQTPADMTDFLTGYMVVSVIILAGRWAWLRWNRERANPRQ